MYYVLLYTESGVATRTDPPTPPPSLSLSLIMSHVVGKDALSVTIQGLHGLSCLVWL